MLYAEIVKEQSIDEDMLFCEKGNCEEIYPAFFETACGILT